MRSTRSLTCRTPASCATPSTTTPAWRRIFRWPLFSLLAVTHLALLPLVLGGDDRTIAMLGGVGYLLLAALDWRTRRPASST